MDSSDYEADDERFGTRKERFLEDEMEGPLSLSWGTQNEVEQRRVSTTKVTKATSQTTTSSIKTTTGSSERNGWGIIHVENVSVRAPQPSTSLKIAGGHGSLVTANSSRKQAGKEKDQEAKSMQLGADMPISEPHRAVATDVVREPPPLVRAGVANEFHREHDERAKCISQVRREKVPIRESLQSNTAKSGPRAAATITSGNGERESSKENDAKARFPQQISKRLTSTPAISRTTSVQESSMQAPEVPSKALLKGKKKAPSLPVPMLPMLEERPAPVTTKPKSPPRSVKVPSTLQIVLENFNNFEMAVGVAHTGAKIRFKKGKGMVGIDKVDLTKQSEVFKGCVVAVAHHISAKGEQLVPRWAQVHRHGGKVCVRYTPEVTHIACDRDVNESSLCHYLGINSLSDLPRGIPILAWDWFHKCSASSQLLAIEMFLRPCLRTQTSVSRRLSSTSSLGASKRKGELDIVQATTANKRSKKYAPTDSDTSQSQRNSRYIPTQVYATSPEPMDIEDDRTDGDRKRKRPPFQDEHGSDDEQERRRIVGTASGSKLERWQPPASGEKADPLDEMISGLQKGTLIETEQDLAEEADLLDEAKFDGLAKISRLGGCNEDSERQVMESDGPYKCQNAHTGENPISVNEVIIRGLESLSKTYENAQHKSEFQKRSYTLAISSVRGCPFPIQNMQQALKLKGIGCSMAKRIEEIIKNGGISDRERFEDNEQARTVTAFGNIYGVGSSKANELWNAGARNLDDLRNGSWGLTEAQQIGLKYYDDLMSRIPRPEVERLFERIKKEALHIDGCGDKENRHLLIEAMGSYRRGEAASGDLDILITRDPSDGKDHRHILRKLIERLVGKNVITFTLSAPSNYEDLEAKWMGLGQLVGPDGKPEGPMRRIDILMVPWENYGAAQIYFTGNEIFNRSLRLYARRNGYSLNQRGLYKGAVRDEKNNKTAEGILVASRSEQEIFDVLGIRYRPPHLRRP